MTESTPHGPKQPNPWVLPGVLALALAAVVAAVCFRIAPNHDDATPWNAPPRPADSVQVMLVWRAEGHADREANVPWREGMTVYEATRQAGAASPEGWRSAWKGEGEMAFLTELGGLENEGMVGKNWLFSVNGERADRGAGAVEMGPEDRVLWEFALYE